MVNKIVDKPRVMKNIFSNDSKSFSVITKKPQHISLPGSEIMRNRSWKSFESLWEMEMAWGIVNLFNNAGETS